MPVGVVPSGGAEFVTCYKLCYSRSNGVAEFVCYKL